MEYNDLLWFSNKCALRCNEAPYKVSCFKQQFSCLWESWDLGTFEVRFENPTMPKIKIASANIVAGSQWMGRWAKHQMTDLINVYINICLYNLCTVTYVL